MPAEKSSPWFSTEQVGAVTVVRFTHPRILEDETIAQVREELFDLVDRGNRLFVLNFGRVTGLASRMLGQLVALHNRLRTSGGRLVLCEVGPFLYDFFATAKLPDLLCIRGNEQEALEALNAPP